jgi:biopolymer transport protein ExbD
MKFRGHNQGSQMPELNLVPLMDVIMTILIYFIVVSMTLTNFQGVDVTLPGQGGAAGSGAAPIEPLVIGLNLQGQILAEGTVVSPDELAQVVTQYLNEKPKGVVILKADRAVPYEGVVVLLSSLQRLGGERVSLAVE